MNLIQITLQLKLRIKKNQFLIIFIFKYTEIYMSLFNI